MDALKSAKNLEIVNKIRAIMIRREMSQKDFALLLNKRESEVSRWMSNKVCISAKNLERIEAVFGEPVQTGSGVKNDAKVVAGVQRNYAIILAGGVGSRVGASVPKQFVEILGKPVLAYTIEVYQNHPDIDGIEIVCVNHYEDTLRDMIKKYQLTKVRWICQGGATFQDSVYNGVRNLVGKIDKNDIVMVHYGAAPFTSAQILTDAIRVCRQYGSSVSFTPCFQLMGSNDGDGESKCWVDRDKYVQIACPQSFRFQYICDIYEEAIENNLLSKVEPHTTSLMYLMGETLHLSYGDQSNIKITTKEDLDMFEGYALMRLYREGKITIKD